MNIHEERYGAVTVVRPEGPLADADAGQFKQRLQDVLQKNLGRVVLDASAVPVVDSAGLEALVDVNAEMAQSGRSLKLCAVNQTVRQVLELTGLSSQFEHFEDANSAVRSFL